VSPSAWGWRRRAPSVPALSTSLALYWGVDLVELWRVLRRHPVVFVACTLVCLALAGAWTLTRDPLYEASATGIVSAPASSSTFAGDDDEKARSRATTYVALGATRGMATRVTDVLHSDLDPGTLLAQTSFEQPPDTALVQVHVRSTSATSARRLADAWLTELSARVQEIENPDGGNGASSPSLTTVEPASEPDAPVYPRPPLNLAIGLAAGLVLGVAGALARDRADQRIRDAVDVKERLGMGVLAEVPSSVIRRAKKSRAKLGRRTSARRHELDPVFVDIRTKLQYLNVDRPPRSLLVTSTVDGAGSSTVAREVARAIAEHGESVVLVELDFNSPTMGDLNRLDPDTGILQVLTGLISIREALQDDEELGGLTYLVAGGSAPNTAELLGSKALPLILETLNEDSYLVLDASPMPDEPATALLLSLVDAALLVVLAGRTSTTALARAIDEVTTKAGKSVGIALTGAGKRSRAKAVRWPLPGGIPTNRSVADPPDAANASEERVGAEPRRRSAS
jgi:capsular polysaccharide biosynthesis protein/Mrp family chromosome partitioning ATPase